MERKLPRFFALKAALFAIAVICALSWLYYTIRYRDNYGVLKFMPSNARILKDTVRVNGHDSLNRIRVYEVKKPVWEFVDARNASVSEIEGIEKLKAVDLKDSAESHKGPLMSFLTPQGRVKYRVHCVFFAGRPAAGADFTSDEEELWITDGDTQFTTIVASIYISQPDFLERFLMFFGFYQK